MCATILAENWHNLYYLHVFQRMIGHFLVRSNVPSGVHVFLPVRVAGMPVGFIRPGYRIVVSAGMTGVKHFAEPDGSVAVLFEILRQRGEVPSHVPEVVPEIVRPRGVGPSPCQQ